MSSDGYRSVVHIEVRFEVCFELSFEVRLMFILIEVRFEVNFEVRFDVRFDVRFGVRFINRSTDFLSIEDLISILLFYLYIQKIVSNIVYFFQLEIGLKEQ